jgi:hypothetical protein
MVGRDSEALDAKLLRIIRFECALIFALVAESGVVELEDDACAAANREALLPLDENGVLKVVDARIEADFIPLPRLRDQRADRGRLVAINTAHDAVRADIQHGGL